MRHQVVETQVVEAVEAVEEEIDLAVRQLATRRFEQRIVGRYSARRGFRLQSMSFLENQIFL